MNLSQHEDDILCHINHRETLLQRLESLHQEARHARGNRIQRLLHGIHNASLAVVEAIEAWNSSKQEEWYRRRNMALHIEPHTTHELSKKGEKCPYNMFLWNEKSYLKKMIYDLDFVRDIPEAIALFGTENVFHRNPFLLPNSIDELVQGHEPSSTSPWNDIDLRRIRNASFIILLDEFHHKKGTTAIMTKATLFPPNKIHVQELSALHGMSHPPVTAIVALSCAHLVLNTVEDDVTNKLLFLTKAILLKIFRYSLTDLVKKTRSFNPLQKVDRNLIKIIAPFVMHDMMKPGSQTNVPEEIVHLLIWLRVLVLKSIETDDNRSACKAANRVIMELKSDNHKHTSQYRDLVFHSAREAHPTHDDNKENTRVNVSVQTEEFRAENDKEKLNDSTALEASALSAIENLLEDGKSLTVQQVPLPVTINVAEGSRIVVVNGTEKAIATLQMGDTIRIYDAHESSDWRLSNDPTISDETITFCLTEAYDHSRIVAQQNKSRENALYRLCYPYKRDGRSETDNKFEGALSTAIEDAFRHVASDKNQSIHSPLHIREARIWKLIPTIEDNRPQWRRDYDNGDIRWVDEYVGCSKTDSHFRVNVLLELIEQNCRDWPYLLDDDLYIHQQRVNYFELIPLPDVIDEAFHAVCKWHPKGTLVDNVKWAKLSRKMQFLPNVKNAQHEIDMAFVRHSRDRKLDIQQFHAIFEDIASIQHPSMPTRDSLTEVVWSSIVMLPDVNAMMWRESKAMAIREEARRVCAQIRIASFVRKVLQFVKFTVAKQSAIAISKHIRRFLSRQFVAKILKTLHEDKEYQHRVKYAIVVQKEWRRFFWRNRFLCHQERVRAERRKQILTTHAKLKEERERRLASIVYRDVIRIDETLAVVTIYFHDDTQLRGDASMQLTVYVVETRRTFSFRLTEKEVRTCLEKALASEGNLSWDEMLRERSLRELPKRLIMRLVRNQPIFIFSRTHIVEKGILVDKRIVRTNGEMFILSTFRSPHDFVFSTYQPSKRQHMRTKLTVPKLIEWIHETKEDDDRQMSILHPKRQDDLIEWLVKRVLIRKNPLEDEMMILLQFEAEEERVLNLVTKVQAQWRRLRSFRRAKNETLQQYEKIFDRENQMYVYRNMLTDHRQKDKPKLLGEDELENPQDEWRKEKAYDASTGQTVHYYANYATGQSSWLSEEEAARLVQRRYRAKHESDLIGRKMTFLDVVKAMKFIKGARAKYEQDPSKLSNIVNYAMLTHCLDLDFDAARPIYEKAMKLSPSHPLISRVYAIFLLASRQTPHDITFRNVCQLLEDADMADRKQTMMSSAAEIFFRWAVLGDARNPLTLLNYALLHQCVYKNYDRAEKLYRAALAIDPSNTLVAENYRHFVDECYPSGVYESIGPLFSVVQRSNVVEERLDWAEWRKMVDPLCPKKGFEIFWFNRFSKATRWEFNEPDWNAFWEVRLRRSKWCDGKTTAQSKFYDERTKSYFVFNAYTQQYTSLQS